MHNTFGDKNYIDSLVQTKVTKKNSSNADLKLIKLIHLRLQKNDILKHLHLRSKHMRKYEIFTELTF